MPSRADHPPWWDHAIWWQVYPLGFTGAPRTGGDTAAPAAGVPRLRSLEHWLKYLVELGCNGLALGPVFASSSHGYDTVDHYRVDPRLGTADDLRRLFDACHDAGVRVLLDGVFNHVGRQFSRFADVVRNGPAGSGYADWFQLDATATDRAHGFEADGFGYRCFEGHAELVVLNHANPAVVDYVADVMSHWLAAGADGWRLDAAYAMPLPFLRAVSDRVHRAHPQAWLVGEVIHGDYPAFVRDGGLDAVTQYELWKAIWSSLNDRNFFELAWTLERHDAVTAVFAPATFVGNHDVTRLASRLTDVALLDHAGVVLCTVGGVPSVYYGDEQAF
nr:alpha-amylase family glycosyl hydrolase [Micromonospora sp. DSM 115978]